MFNLETTPEAADKKETEISETDSLVIRATGKRNNMTHNDTIPLNAENSPLLAERSSPLQSFKSRKLHNSILSIAKNRQETVLSKGSANSGNGANRNTQASIIKPIRIT